MRKWISFTLSFFIAASLFSTVKAEERYIYYVDGKAEQSGDGTVENPFKSISDAQKAIRELKKERNYPSDGIIVYIREGSYNISESVSFTGEDSGKENAPVIYRAYPSETVEFTGGSEITLGDCKMVENVSFNPALDGKIYSYNLKENGLKGYDRLYCTGHSQWDLNIAYPDDIPSDYLLVPEVFYNDQVTSIARYPNGNEYMRVGSVIRTGNVIGTELASGKPLPPFSEAETMKFKVDVEKSRLQNWKNEKNAWLFGYWRYDWSDQTTPIRKIDTDEASIETEYPTTWGLMEGQRFYIYNALSELDSPGEWFYDNDSGEFYIYPPDNDINSKILLGFSSNNLFELNNCSNIELREINMKGTRANGIIVNECQNVNIFGCDIKNISGAGISVSGGKNVTIDSCHIYNVGGRGIYVLSGDYETLERGDVIVTNNWVHNFGRLTKTYCGALTLNGVGNTARFNLFYDGPHLGIQFGGNDNLIEYNDISNVLKEAADSGALYAGRSMIKRGTVIRGNIIHDLKSNSDHGGQYGVYLDDCQSGYTVDKNLFYNLSDTGVFINGGRDTEVTNNVFVNMNNSIRFAATGLALTWGYGLDYLPNLGITNGGLHTTDPYKKYPHLSDLTEDDNPMAPKYDVIKNNISYNVSNGIRLDTHNAEGSNITEKQMRIWSEIENDTVVGADAFEAPEKGNYNIKHEISEKLNGFEAIDFNKAGLITSRLKNELSKDSVVLAIGKPLAYVNWKRMLIDKNNIDVVPEIKNDLTYVPIRFLAEMLNGDVGYENDTAIIDYNGKRLEIPKNSVSARIDGEKTELAGASYIENSRMYVPLRSCSYLFDKEVFWDDRGLIIVSEDDMTGRIDDDMIENLINRL